ncbi:DNA polymerase III subunit delta [Methylophilaceae bacterium]|nr:DNA polymerase III subunit delta [Methylophilaceae bacterium]
MLVKFAPTNILSDLKENKKNCLVIVGKEPIQILTVKDDINKSCQNNSIDKILIKVENSIDLNQLDHTFNNQSLFSSQIIYEFEVSDGIIKKEIKESILKKISEHTDSYFIFYFKKDFKEFRKQSWYELLKHLSQTIIADEPETEQITQAIKDRAHFHQVKLTNEAKKLLTNYSMGNLMQAENDIKKLKLIYDKQEVDESMLLSLITNGSKYDGFNFIEHCINGDIKKTNEAARYLKEEGVQPLMINGLFAWFFKAVSRIKLSSNQPINTSVLFKLRIFGASQNLASQTIRSLTAKQVVACLNKIQEIDQIGKGIKMGDPWLEINRFSVGIAKMMNRGINLKNG